MDLDKEYYMGMMGVEASASAMSPAVSSEPVAKAVAATASEDEGDLRRGPWTAEEDALLVDYVAKHGEGRWNSLARCAGLRRTGKSCRLRWLNYLRPDVRRGNITAEEQLLILDLHSRWGNRWSKIAQRLPGRTDNEIKNYWRTRVQKHARQLRCDVNSRQFRDVVRLVWIPRLIERMHADANAGVPPAPEATAAGAAAAAAQCYGGGHVERQGMSRSEPMIGRAAEAAAMSPDDTSSTLRSSMSTAEMASTMHEGQYRLSPWGAASALTANNADGTAVNCVVRGDEGAMGGDDHAIHGGDNELGGSWSELLAATGLPEFEFGDFDDNLWSLEDIYAN